LPALTRLRARPSPIRSAGPCLLLLVATTLIGCATPPQASPTDTARDPDHAVAARVRAVRQLGQTPDAASRDTLRALAFSPDAPVPVANVAIEALAARHPALYLNDLADQLDRLSRWPVLTRAIDAAQLAIDRVEPTPDLRTRLAAAAARSLARPSARLTDADRPERSLLAALDLAASPEATLLTLADPATATAATTRLTDRTAAWTAYHRLVGPAAAREAARALSADSLPAATLRRCADLLDQLPHNGPTLAHAMTTAWPAESPGWPAGVALRHLPFLTLGLPVPFPSPGDPVAPPTAAAPRQRRGAALPALPNEDYRHNKPRLTDADHQHLTILARAIRQPDTAADLFRLADTDHADPTTERGGLLILTDHHPPRVAFRQYPPQITGNDHAYTPGPELLLDLHQRGLAHVHCHAQRHDNAAYAGPAAGDLAFVRRHAVAAIVLTFLDEHTLNVDYAQPDPTDPNATPLVIDLGNLHR